MEFVPYSEAIHALTDIGVRELPADDAMHFELQPRGLTPGANPTISQLVIAPHSDGSNHRINLPADQLGRAVERLIHTAHLAEILIIPVGLWRDVLDLTAFELADDEDWADIDAEATLHQNSRDPLGLLQRQRGVVARIVDALVAGGSEPRHGLTITALDVPLLIEIRPDPAVIVSCPGPEVAESLAAGVA